MLQGNEVVVAESPAIEHQSHSDTSSHEPQYQPDPRYLPDFQYRSNPQDTTQGRPRQPHYSITPPWTPQPPESPTHHHTAGPGVGPDPFYFLSRNFFFVSSPLRFLLHFLSLPGPQGWKQAKFLTSAFIGQIHKTQDICVLSIWPFDFRIYRPFHIITL